ncbi:hypothetical protein BN12_150026 [Nostocoides japonicum T1-X7]|uniref:Uncharacterized protein n=1 Tax=Nostocoides japonicum T1-X7 TaxID=1194083 RepID=A0A077LVK8_9MICO|nr:hypothetical protein BN12_150026 [Tetrasphaera japonica T1-X7]
MHHPSARLVAVWHPIGACAPLVGPGPGWLARLVAVWHPIGACAPLVGPWRAARVGPWRVLDTD